MKIKIRRTVIWSATWITLSTIVAFLSFTICDDRAARCGVGIFSFLILLGLYSISVMNDYKKSVMPINKYTLFYLSTMLYMVINVLALAFIPHILVSVFVFILAIIPKPTDKFFDE